MGREMFLGPRHDGANLSRAIRARRAVVAFYQARRLVFQFVQRAFATLKYGTFGEGVRGAVRVNTHGITLDLGPAVFAINRRQWDAVSRSRA